MIIIFFIIKSYNKRVNQKLQEYKDNIDAVDFGKSHLEMLREFAGYSTDQKYSRGINFEYELGAKEKYQKIIKLFALDKVTEGKQDTDLIFALLKWLYETFGQDGNSGYPDKRDANSIIKFAQKKGGKINSHMHCMLLAELLRAYGIKAYHVLCLRFEEPHNNYDALVHAYSESLNKWIMLDTGSNVCLRDKDNNYISIPEFRNMAVNGEEFFMNSDAKTDPDCKKFSEYWATYMIRFSRAEKNYYGSDIWHNNTPNKMLIPEKYLKYTQNFGEHVKPNLFLSERDFWEM
jgi:hypothetical protein